MFIPLSELVSLLLLLAVICIYTKETWFLIASIPIVLGFIIVFLPIFISKYKFPKFIKNNNAIISVLIDVVLLLLMLLYINFYTNGNWFLRVSVPFTLIAMLLPVFIVIITRYTKINAFLKTGIILLFSILNYSLLGISVIPILNNGGIDTSDTTPFSIRGNFKIWTEEYINQNVQLIIFLTMLLLAVIFTFIGCIKLIKEDK